MDRQSGELRASFGNEPKNWAPFGADGAPQRLFFSVGEPSGDLHASKLITQLRRSLPHFQIEGLGGPLMREAGCHLHYELTNLAVVGIAEVLPKLKEFFRVADLA